MSATVAQPQSDRTEDRDGLSVEEFARRYGISATNVRIGVRSGQIPSFRVGRRIVIPRDAADRMIAAQQSR